MHSEFEKKPPKHSHKKLMHEMKLIGAFQLKMNAIFVVSLTFRLLARNMVKVHN